MILIRDNDVSHCPEGIYKAVLQSIGEREHDKYGNYLLFVFEVEVTLDQQALSYEVTYACSTSLSIGSKLRKAIKTLLDHDLSDKEAKAGFELDKLVGCICKVIVKHAKGKDDSTYSRVEAVLPS